MGIVYSCKITRLTTLDYELKNIRITISLVLFLLTERDAGKQIQE